MGLIIEDGLIVGKTAIITPANELSPTLGQLPREYSQISPHL